MLWYKGYAFEGAQKVLDYALNTLNLDEVFSFTAKANTPSIRLMEKLGMNYKQDFIHPNVPNDAPLAPHVLYHLKKRSKRI